MTDSNRSPISPGTNSDAGIIPIVLSPPPLPGSPSAAPIAMRQHIATLQVPPQSQGHFREVGVDDYDMPALPPMPFSPESPSGPGVKWSRVREMRASLKPSKWLPPPLPSPSIYDGGFDAGVTQEEEQKTQSVRRKTLLQRALEGWWDLPGVLGRSDTVRGKTKPFPSKKEQSEFV